MNNLFSFNKLDLSSVPALRLIFTDGFDSEQIEQLRKFETTYSKYLNVNEVRNYETAEQLIPAFSEFLEEEGLLEIDSESDEGDIEFIALITSVTQVIIGGKATLIIELTPASEDDYSEDDDFQDLEEDDFEA